MRLLCKTLILLCLLLQGPAEVKPPAVISKPATEALAPQPKKNVKPKSGNNKPKEAKALTALDKGKLRKKKLERMRGEISTTIMGLQSGKFDKFPDESGRKC